MIYVDLLIIENIIINYCIIIGTSLILNRITTIKKVLLSSIIGCILLIFFCLKINSVILFLISIIIATIMSIISFKYKDMLYTIKNVIYIYFLSIFLAGSIYLINTNFLPKINNYVINTIILIILFPIITIIYIKNIKNIKDNYSNYYKLDIYLKENQIITVNSYLDTGNLLTDPYFNYPVILVNKKLINIKNEKIIYVPYNTIDNHNLLKCIKPDNIYIHKIGHIKKVLVGLIDEVGIEGAESILNKKALERIKK